MCCVYEESELFWILWVLALIGSATDLVLVSVIRDLHVAVAMLALCC